MLELVSKMYRKLKNLCNHRRMNLFEIIQSPLSFKTEICTNDDVILLYFNPLSILYEQDRDIEYVCIASLLPDTDSTPKSFHLHALLVTKTLVSIMIY